MEHLYSSATQTEKWRYARGEWTRLSLTLDGGSAVGREDGSGFRISAASETPAAFAVIDQPIRQVFEKIASMRDRATATVRLQRRSVEADGVRDTSESATVSIALGGARPLSISTRISDAASALQGVGAFAGDPPRHGVDARNYPIVWRAGSAAVLLHEAIGHPSEAACDALRWPEWLEVLDDPQFDALGFMRVDDAGRESRARVLSSGQQPSALRRASYRDVPLRRLTNIVARYHDDAFDEPLPRIEVFLIGRGHYDRVHDAVAMRVDIADLVTKDERVPLAPFEFAETRPSIAFKLRGARGEGIRYPGVICSREGQRLPVGSFAPDLLTDAFGS